MDNRIIGIGIAILIIIGLIWFIKSDNVISNLLGFIGKVIAFLIIAALVIFIILRLTSRGSVEAPGMGTDEPEETRQADVSIINQNDDGLEENEYVITIRQKDVEVTNKLIGNATYSEKLCTEEEISKKLEKIAIKDPIITVVDDYADYYTYSFVMEELIDLGISKDKITESSGESK